MKSTYLNYSIENQKVYLSKGEKLEYWGNACMLLFIIVMIFIIDIQADLNSGRFPLVLILLATLALLLVNHKINSRKYEIWKVNLSKQQFTEAFIATSITLDWHILINEANYLSASKAISWQWEGIRITAIRTENEIYFNSMIEPSVRSNPFSFGWNRKNKDEFRKNILRILEGENVVNEAELLQRKQDELFWNESEWTFTNSLKRIIGYGLAIPFAILGFWFILKGGFKGMIPGLMILVLCLSYMYYDIQIIQLKRNKRK